MFPVSIHAPTRGATPRGALPAPTARFQSTHPHGVRRPRCSGCAAPCCFNPRTHTGCDPDFYINYPPYNKVSIHAPTRGATNLRILYLIPSFRFNPRTHTGCDLLRLSFLAINSRFNPRTHTGCDITTMTSLAPILRFNPRTHTGCDPSEGIVDFGSYRVSIHAPTRGATTEQREKELTDIVSIHAPTRGATPKIAWSDNILRFQSTHPHGVRQPADNQDVTAYAFQSTHPHGVRP